MLVSATSTFLRGPLVLLEVLTNEWLQGSMNMNSSTQMIQPQSCIPAEPREIQKVLCSHIRICYTRFKPILFIKMVFMSPFIKYWVRYYILKETFVLLVSWITLQIKNLSDFVPAKAGERFLSMLPSWHAYERACEYFIFTCGVEQKYTSIRFLKVSLSMLFYTMTF